MKIGLLPDAMKPGIHGVGTRRLPGFHGVPAAPAHSGRDADGADVSWVRFFWDVHPAAAAH